MSNSTHRVNVVRIGEITKHPAADTLGITFVGGYQIVVKNGNYNTGDLALYIQPDTIVPVTSPFSFLWEGRTLNADGSVPQRLRRITVKKLRGVWSEGLLMPLSILPVSGIGEGDDVAELLGCTHYEEPEAVDNINRTKPQYQSPFRSWMAFKYWLLYKLGINRSVLHRDNAKPPKNAPPTYDVEGFKNFPNAIFDGEEVVVMEKIHGSNARYMFDGKKMHVGSKNLWKSEKSTCIWRKSLKDNPWIEEMCRGYEGVTFYAEVTPTQKGYTYGCSADAQPTRVFFYDMLTPEGNWMDKQWFTKWETEPSRVPPVLYSGPFDAAKIKALADGPSKVPGANHIREGVVVSLAKERKSTERGLNRVQLKIKGMKFLEAEGKA